jgi:Putative endonuclease segE, GIY-YIG domain
MEQRLLVWTYKGKEFTENDIDNNYGFVYIITNMVTGKKYVGKKLFWFSKTKQVNKKKKKIKVSSDWPTYYGSNDKLSKDVETLGKENFTREIIHLCKSKGECSYLEAKEQFNRNVIESDEYYNTWIMVRVRDSHIKQLIESNRSGQNI